MAGVLTVLQAVQTTVGAIPGIVRAERDIPAVAPREAAVPAELPLAICRLDIDRQGVITLGAEQRRTYPIRVDVLVERQESDQTDTASAYQWVVAVADAFSDNVTVQQVGSVWHDIEWQIGLMVLWETVYWAASLMLTIEEHAERIVTE